MNDDDSFYDFLNNFDKKQNFFLDDIYSSIYENSFFHLNDISLFDIDDKDDSSSKLDLQFKDDESLSLDKESKNNINNNNLNAEEIEEFNENFYDNLSINDKSNIKEKIKNTNENENLYKSNIIDKNRSLSNSDNFNNKVMNQTLPNKIPLNKNDENFIINQEFVYFNKTKILNLNSQISFSDYKYNDRTNFSNKSKFFDSFSFFEKNNDSFNSTLSNKKRKRNNTKINNTFLNINNNFNNIPEFLPKQDINSDKSKLFIIDKKNNNGRKKKNSGETGKHTRESKDNLRSKVKSLSLTFLYEYFNNEIKKIDINNLNKSAEWRLYKIKTFDNKTKVYYLDLLNKSLKSIFSTPISGRVDKNENHNKDLINKIYKINQEGNLEKTEKIIKLFNMKYEEFFNYVKNINDNKNLQEKIDVKDDDIKELIKNFDIYLKKKLSKDSKDEKYNKQLIEEIKNFPSDIKNMKETKNNNNN